MYCIVRAAIWCSGRGDDARFYRRPRTHVSQVVLCTGSAERPARRMVIARASDVSYHDHSRAPQSKRSCYSRIDTCAVPRPVCTTTAIATAYYCITGAFSRTADPLCLSTVCKIAGNFTMAIITPPSIGERRIAMSVCSSVYVMYFRFYG